MTEITASDDQKRQVMVNFNASAATCHTLWGVRVVSLMSGEEFTALGQSELALDQTDLMSFRINSCALERVVARPAWAVPLPERDLRA